MDHSSLVLLPCITCGSSALHLMPAPPQVDSSKHASTRARVAAPSPHKESCPPLQEMCRAQ